MPTIPITKVRSQLRGQTDTIATRYGQLNQYQS
jgi:hypothetical protein